jgi:LytS/YehU family sensor histidine kinase
MRGNQWIYLMISVTNNQLDFNLSNSKPQNASVQKNKKSIGLMNVRKRLQLLYPEKHFLEIISTEDVYEVRLTLTLQSEILTEEMQQPALLKNPIYA